ncbi:MAG: NUDIX domain-containing protein [Bacteroidota bacterium]
MFLHENVVDCVVLAFDEGVLKVLLLKWKVGSFWSLPGGYVMSQESLDDAAARILADRTGLGEAYLEQFHTFSDPTRAFVSSPKDVSTVTEMMKELDPKGDLGFIDWLTKRFLSTGYLSLVRLSETQVSPDFLIDSCHWIDVTKLPPLGGDHDHIVGTAVEHLRKAIRYSPIGLSLLPERFLMKDFQQMYEAILDTSLDRSNFQRKILKQNILIRHEKRMSGGAHRAPYLYSFDHQRYSAKARSGLLS